MNIFQAILSFINKLLASTNIVSETGDVQAIETNAEGKMKKVAICVGINNYPGTANDLQGCVNDARDWGNLLKSKFGFGKVTYLLDSAATSSAVISALKTAIAEAQSGDTLVFTYSGHGTSVADKNGDEADGKDEAMCLYDKFLVDDDIRSVLDGVKEGVKFTIISDSCFSGTVTRAHLGEMDGEVGYKRARYMPPPTAEEAVLVARLPVKNRLFSTEDMKDVLITGCNDREYSYDTAINGKPNGAMTYNAIQSINSKPDATYEEFFAELRKRLPSKEYPQTPQLEGSSANLKSKIFGC